jgi:hypothetical protein
MRLLGLLSPVAVRLVHLRDLARRTPDCPASQAARAEALALIAARTERPPSTLTVGAFCKLWVKDRLERRGLSFDLSCNICLPGRSIQV